MKYRKRMSAIGAVFYGLVAMMIFAPIAPAIGIGMAVGALILTQTPLPSGILGSGVAGAETPEELKEKALIEKLGVELGKKFKALVDADEDLKAIKALRAEIGKMKTEEDYKKVTDQIEELSLKVKGLSENPVAKEQKASTLADLFGNAYKEMMFDKDGGFKSLKKGEQRTLEVKVAGTMTTSNIDAVGTNSIPFTLAQFEQGLTRIVRRMPFIQELCNVGTTLKKYVQWAEQANADDGEAATTAEGAAKHQTDFDIVEKSAEVKKITAYIKVSTEMLDDVDFMRSEINTELMEIIKLKLDEQILLGDGTGTNLSGIITTATAWAAGNFADTIVDANEYDVLRTAISQIETATPNGPFTPNYIVLHPEDLAKMELEKDTQGRYVIYPFGDAVGGKVKGVPIITNIGMTAGKFLVGDFTKSRVLIRKDATIAVGYENDDFTKNLVTILGELRAVHYVKTNYLKAFVYGDFSDAIVDLDPALT